MAKFKVHARVLDLLGVEQIADMPTAVSELFKNSYDAYADNVVLELFRHKQHAILWDDGVGMSQDDIENRWLVVGTPGKKVSPPVVRGRYEKRPVMGEKGIGRLAISTLGDTLLLLSKKRTQNSDSFTALFLNWKIVRNHKLMIDDFDIPILPFSSLDEFTQDIYDMLLEDFSNQLKITSESGKWKGYENLLSEIETEIDSFKPDLTLFHRIGAFSKESGTVFYMGNLTYEVNSLAKPMDRYDTTDRNIYDQIVLLLSNFSKSRIDYSCDIDNRNTADFNSKDSFFTDVRIWDEELKAPSSIFEEKALFQPEDLGEYDHYFDIQFDDKGRYTGTIIRYGEKLEPLSIDKQIVMQNLKCGPFGFKFWSWQGDLKESLLDEAAFNRIKEKLRYSGGIMVYRDGLRVLPYGIPENDWLEIEQRRSKGAGYYFFSYRRMFGYVVIDAVNNPELKDKAGREGMIKNKAYRDLRIILENFLQNVVALYFRDNEDFRAKQDKIKAESKVLKDHKKSLTKKRKDLLGKLSKSLAKIESLEKRLKKQKEATGAKLNNSQIPVVKVEELIFSFEKRIQQILGEAKVAIPQTLSLGRGREINQVVFDYKEKFNKLQKDIDLARDEIIQKAEIACPEIEKRLLKRKLLESSLSTGKMQIGKAFADINKLIDENISTFSDKVDNMKSSALVELEKALMKSTGAESVDEALGSEKGIEDAVSAISQAVNNNESKCLELKEELSQVFKNALSGNNTLVMSIQDNRIEELEKKIQETVELAQIGLSVEMIHHDLHNMFRGISGSIRSLRHMFKNIPEAILQVNSLQSTFQHLELRYRQLEPLYRMSYKRKNIISGQNIINFIKQFLAHDMDVAGITLDPTENFLNFKILEAQALIYPAFVNLIDNAIYWLRSVKERKISFDVINGIIAINDTGPGVHETMLESIFEAFTTTKNDGRGLGLYIARQSLELASHEIWATNDLVFKKYKGACFCIKLSDKSLIIGSEEANES